MEILRNVFHTVGIFSNKKEQIPDTCNATDGSHKQKTEYCMISFIGNSRTGKAIL